MILFPVVRPSKLYILPFEVVISKGAQVATLVLGSLGRPHDTILRVRLVLFDIDGTLLLSGGAGIRALQRALQKVYGLDNGLASIRPDGKTDRQIVREVLQLHDRNQDYQETALGEVFSSYVSFLQDELRSAAQFSVLPGARELLLALEQNAGLLMGLATGNIEAGARLKLDRAGLTAYFPFGGFGCDAEDRTQVIHTAIERGKQKISPREVERIFVVGDTPRDIRHGREAGAVTVAVATGSYSLTELEACGPDYTFAGMFPIEPLISVLTAT